MGWTGSLAVPRAAPAQGRRQAGTRPANHGHEPGRPAVVRKPDDDGLRGAQEIDRQHQAHDRLQRRRPGRAKRPVDEQHARQQDHCQHRAHRGPCRAGDHDRDRRQGRRAVLQHHQPGAVATDLPQGNSRHPQDRDLRGAVCAAATQQQRTAGRVRRGQLPATARLRGDQRKTPCRDTAADDAGRPAAGPLAIRAGTGGGVYVRRQGQVGQQLDWLGRLPDFLVADRQLEPAPCRNRRPLSRCRDRTGPRHHQRRGHRHRRQFPKLP